MRRFGFALFSLLALTACGRDEAASPAPADDLRPGAPNANRELAEKLAAGRERLRHPADGGGRAWLTSPSAARVGEPAHFQIVYEAGAQGIALGGMIAFQASPYWNWSWPQAEDPAAPGFTLVTTAARGVRLEPRTTSEGLFEIVIAGRALRAGEQVRIAYGVGAQRAQVDRFAERESGFFLGVDGNGDGWREWIADPPAIDIAAGPPARLVLHLPATARPGDALPLHAAVLDDVGNAGVEFAGALRLTLPPGVEGPAELVLPAEARGVSRAELRMPGYGIVRVRAEGPGGLTAESNPCVVTPDGPRILFGDVHGHSNLSDGTGTPEDFHRYARDVAGLDVVALTDHDHWGHPFLDEAPANWARIEAAVSAFHEPGRFVTLLGYEWTNWIFGHRHVLHFEDRAELLSSVDPRFDTPHELWAGLRGKPALTFAHHSAGGPVATDWRIAPDPVLEPLTEIVSVHGSSESLDTPGLIHGFVPGNSVRDALGRGYRLGFIGSGDSHDGHPGLAQLADGGGAGLAGIFAEELTREAVLAALRARRTYATNGPRIVLDATLDGKPMGASLPGGAGKKLAVRVAAPAPLAAIEVVTPDGVIGRNEVAGERSVGIETDLPELAAGGWLYVRVLQRDGGAAWSSPFFFE